MGVGAEGYARMLKALLPPGRAWKLVESFLEKVFLATGDELARVDDRGDDLIVESDPRTADELLPDFESALELSAEGTIDERRNRVVALLVRRQRCRPADFQRALAPLLRQDVEDVVVIENDRAFAIAVDDDREIYRFFIYRDPGAVTFGSAGSAGITGTGAEYPAAIEIGNLLVLVVASKYPANPPTTPSGWTFLTSKEGGSGAPGADSGNVLTSVYYRIADGSETPGGFFGISHPGGNIFTAQVFRYTAPVDATWELTFAAGADNSAGTSWSVTGDVDPGLTTHDVLLVVSGVNTDAATYSAHAVAAAGVGFAAVTVRGATNNPNGDDTALIVSEHLVVGGPSSGVPTFTMTGSAGTPAGSSVFLRIRQVSSYDLDAAQVLVDSMAQSHTKGHVIESVAFRCDDPFSLCDRDILGA